VFLTQSAQHAPAEVALKLIPLDTRSAQAQLARWRAATRLSHPHLLRIFQVGVCQLDGAHYLYVLMEYADQTLAQVLEGRALTEDEVREMLAPTLGALEYLHRANLAHGSLKPSNVLVVGDQLKLASDTVRVIGDDDIRALGAMLCEALTRTTPASPDGAGQVELPAALPASFRAVVTRCLSQDSTDRPTVTSLLGWLRGEPLAMNPPAPATTPAPRPDRTIELPSRAAPAGAAPQERASRRALAWALGALALLVLSWLAYRSMRGESEPPTPPPVETPSPATAAPLAPAEPSPAPPAASPGIATNEVLPAVSQSSLATVRGTLRVTVRVSVNKAGTVIAASTDDRGPSRYFERRALEAAKQWKFAPADTNEQRSLRIGFAFTQSGVTASATPLP
jgi:TonB family protein